MRTIRLVLVCFLFAAMAALPQVRSKEAQANFDRGEQLFIVGNYEQALQSFLAVNPQNSESWNYIGRSQFELKRYPEALDAFKNAAKADPSNLEAQINLRTRKPLVMRLERR